MTGTPKDSAKMTEKEVAERIAKLEGWRVADGKLEKEFVFRDFVEAFGFMSRVALHAEKRSGFTLVGSCRSGRSTAAGDPALQADTRRTGGCPAGRNR